MPDVDLGAHGNYERKTGRALRQRPRSVISSARIFPILEKFPLPERRDGEAVRRAHALSRSGFAPSTFFPVAAE